MKHQKDGSNRDLVVLRVNWVFMYPNFHPGVNVCPLSLLHLVNISQSLPHLPVYLYLSSFYLSFHFMHLHFSFLNLFLFPTFSLFTVTFLSCCRPVYFSPRKPDLLKARSSKEKFDISFCPIISRLQHVALWLADSQLIKPLVVWHLVLFSGRVTLLNEIN